MPTTSGRSRGRQGVHSGAQGRAGDHTRAIVTTMVVAAVMVIFVLVMTAAGRDIDAATQHFMLFYAGVFALIGLTGSVLVGLLATDRIVMTPGHRVMAQAVHRAVSFGALTFLVIHIVTEILAQRVHVIDAFIPFLSPFRTFYIGLGTIASDLILLIAVTSIFRKRFTAHGNAWRWRAIHYASYAAFVFGVLHGLLGGRAAKPYVDWSYGFAIALTALGLAVRFLAISMRPKENLSAAPGTGHTRSAGSPLHAAALSLAQAQLGGTVQVLPAGMAIGSAPAGAGSPASWPALPAAREWPSSSGPLPALPPAPAYAAKSPFGAHLSAPPADPYPSPGGYPSAGAFPSPGGYPPGEAYRAPGPYRSAQAYRELGFTPLGAPPYGDDGSATFPGHPYGATDPPMQAQAGPAGPAGPGPVARQPLYEPGYDGPPRFAGAPRGHVPQDELSSYPYGVPGHGPSGAGYPDRYPDPGESSGRNGPRHRRAIGPSAPGPAMPGQPRQGQGDRNTGPIPRVGDGQFPRGGTGPMPRAGTGPMPRAGTGPMPRVDSGPMPRAGTGPMPRAGTGPMPRPDTGPIPRVGGGQGPRTGTGPSPWAGGGPGPWAGTGPMPAVRNGPAQPGGTGARPRIDSPMPPGDPAPSPRDSRPSRAAGRQPRRTDSADPGHREVTGPTGGNEWR